MCAQRDWDGFKTFNKKLNGRQVFDNYERADVLNFLKKLNENPQDHGIELDKHIKGVQILYKAFFEKSCQFVKEGVDVSFFKVSLTIYDIDAALGYVFSACPLPDGATAIDTYLPLLAIYFGKPPGSGDHKVITFGATIRGKHKDEVQARRLQLLEVAFNTTKKEFRQFVPWNYGHCTETYPYICNIERQRGAGFFASRIVGFAVNVENVAGKNFAPFGYNETKDHKRACINCESP